MPGTRFVFVGAPVAARRSPCALGSMKFTSPENACDRDWLSLRGKLWPDANKSEHLREMADTLARDHLVLLAVDSGGRVVGFVEASRRVDFVNGTSSSPVAFLEGLYVQPDSRPQGVARAIVAEVDRWAASQGCSELADSPVENTVAHATHRALGFEEMTSSTFVEPSMLPNPCLTRRSTGRPVGSASRRPRAAG